MERSHPPSYRVFSLLIFLFIFLFSHTLSSPLCSLRLPGVPRDLLDPWEASVGRGRSWRTAHLQGTVPPGNRDLQVVGVVFGASKPQEGLRWGHSERFRCLGWSEGSKDGYCWSALFGRHRTSACRWLLCRGLQSGGWRRLCAVRSRWSTHLSRLISSTVAIRSARQVIFLYYPCSKCWRGPTAHPDPRDPHGGWAAAQPFGSGSRGPFRAVDRMINGQVYSIYAEK